MPTPPNIPQSRGIDIIRSNDTSIEVYAYLVDIASDPIIVGTATVRIFRLLPGAATFIAYDFSDNTFKATATTTPTADMVQQTVLDPSSVPFPTGIWVYRHGILTNFVIGEKYFFYIEHSALPSPIVKVIQYGDVDGDEHMLSTNIISSINVESAGLRIECGMESLGMMKTTPTQCSAQIFDEYNRIMKTIGVGDFGAIGSRGIFGYSWVSHTLITGATYQLLINITDNGITTSTTKLFKMIGVA
jgi:hypothetical protein